MAEATATEANAGERQGRGAGRVPSRRSLFLRSAVPDALLVLVASVALTFTLSYAFESAPGMRSNVALITGLTLPMVAILFAGSWSKRAGGFAAAGAVAYALVVIGAMIAMMPAGTDLFANGQVNDVAENPLIFGLIAMASPVGVFLLSRRRASSILLLAASVVLCGLVQFLYRDFMTAQPGAIACAVALVSVGALSVFQLYRSSLYHAKRIGRTAFGPAAVFSVVVMCLCAGVGALVFFAIISPLGLQTPQIKIFQDTYAQPVIEYQGVYQEQQVDNPDQTTDQTNDQQSDSNQDAEGGSESQSPDNQDDQGADPLTNLIENVSAYNQNSWNQDSQPINYDQVNLTVFIVAVLVAAAIAAVILGQRYRRKRRLEALEGKADAYKIWYLYRFFTERFRRLGMKKADSYTPMEFAMSQRVNMAPYLKHAGTSPFVHLTLAYQRACYAPETVTEDDLKVAERMYRVFYKNAYEAKGKRRWLYWFWRL